ncbi:MAG: class II aldolase/adducin family protein [Bacteroidales bacterium]|nr:MAG: class II aldolase/adducin family protein [Bacteroidales bacterium]
MKSPELDPSKKEVAYFMRRLYKKNLTTTSGGNISCRFDSDTVIISPSELDKARIKGKQTGVITMEGKSLTPGIKFSIETNMHLSIYKKRPDIKAIIHAHPPVSTSFTAMNKSINCKLIAESYFILGTPQVAGYALMGTQSLAKIVSEKAANTNVILLENHGIICLGTSLLEAFNKIEILEASAKMTLITELMNDVRQLTPEQIKEIDNLTH